MSFVTIPRVIGIALLIVAALALKTQTILHAVLLAIPGLILLLTSAAKGRKHWQDFLSSLKFKKEFVLIMLYDVLMFVLLSIILLVFKNVAQGIIGDLRGITLGTGVTIGQVISYNEILGGVFITAIVSIVALWLLTVLAYGVSRTLIWLTLLGKPVKLKAFRTFFFASLVWCTAWLVLILFVMASMQPIPGAYAALVLGLLYAHLTTVFQHSLAKTGAFKQPFSDAFAIGLGKIGSFVHLYVYLFIGYVIVSQVQRVQQGTTLNSVISTAVFIALFAWYRTYMRNILRKQ
jgi:hypothetical protein